VLDAAPSGSLVRLSDCLPATVLRNNEWYNDFVVKSGVSDILGAPLFDSGTHTAVFGIHRGIGQAPFASLPAAPLQELFAVLSKAARLHYEMRSMGWKSAVALRALNQLAAGVIVTEGDGHVIEMNRAAEGIVSLADGLMLRNGRLCAIRVFEDAKLAKAIAACAGNARPAATRLFVGRRSHRPGICSDSGAGQPRAGHG
jgi:hypothetical protein